MHNGQIGSLFGGHTYAVAIIQSISYAFEHF